MPIPVTFDGHGVGTWQALPQVGLFALLALSMSLPTQKVYWEKLFDGPGVHSSAFKILRLKICFVGQTILLSALSSDLIFQLTKNPKAAPQVPGLWLTPVTFIAGIVLSITHSSCVMTNHLMQSLSIAAIPSLVLLNAKFSPVPPQTLEANMLFIYGVSMVAVFWQDVKHFIMDSDFVFPFNFTGLSLTKESPHSHAPAAPVAPSSGLNHIELEETVAVTPRITTERRTDRSRGTRSRSPVALDVTAADLINSSPGMDIGSIERRDRQRNRRH